MKCILALGFSYRDYVFYLTDEENDTSKYNLRAFFNENDLPDGRKELNRWIEFCKKHNIFC